MKKFPSIPNMRQFIHDNTHLVQPCQEEDDDIQLAGQWTITEKIHGTNAGIRLTAEDELIPQSKNRELTVDEDNYGFAQWVENRRSFILNYMTWLKTMLGAGDITLFGEFAGKGINANTALDGAPERVFIVFPYIWVDEEWRDLTDRWTNGDVNRIERTRIYCWPPMQWFPLHTVSDSYTTPHTQGLPSQFQRAMEYAEKNSTAARYFANLYNKEEMKSNIGEGIVVYRIIDGKFEAFKVKGEKHATTRVKKPKEPVADEILAAAATVVPAWRLEQMRDEIDNPSIQDTGVFIKAVMADITKEDSGYLEGFDKETQHKIRKVAGSMAARWFKEQVQ